jgi:fluoroacetyl-CoA thioesterase
MISDEVINSEHLKKNKDRKAKYIKFHFNNQNVTEFENITLTLNEEFSKEYTVLQEQTAAHIGSGSVGVLATPFMILFMEQAARMYLDNNLPEGYTSVGIEVNVKHLKAVKVGDTVIASGKLISQDRRKLIFDVSVTSQNQIIGEGTHTRFIVDKTKFLENL